MENKIKTIDDVKKAGIFKDDIYYNIIRETLKVIDDKKDVFAEKNIDITDTPISPTSFLENNTPICLSDNVINKINTIVPIINNPRTAQEYSFLIVGKSFLDDDRINIYTR